LSANRPARSQASLAQILYSQGFGSRRECMGRILDEQVSIGGQVIDDPDAVFDTEGLVFEVQGRAWPFHAKALIVLNKPPNTECSTKPKHHPGVLSLLPLPLRVRGLQPVGRLDADTTGLLLLTDDGTLIHRLTSPKHHVPKVYEAILKHPLDERQLQALREGVVLDDDPEPVRATAAEAAGEHHLRLTLTEGKYHQVKRMVAAAGNRVEALHRSRFGNLALPPDLPPGGWAWLDAGRSFTDPPR
jgi:16S rRNA pseudouridine516 synthase